MLTTKLLKYVVRKAIVLHLFHLPPSSPQLININGYTYAYGCRNSTASPICAGLGALCVE